MGDERRPGANRAAPSRWAATLLVLALCGCAGTAGLYLPTEFPEGDPGPDPAEIEIESGQPFPPVDWLNHFVLSLPSKLLLWNWRVLDHQMPEESELLLRKHMEVNRLSRALVRHNQYAPIGEWKRLFSNDEVAGGYRYTLGVISLLRYTLLPDRLFAGIPLIGGGDHFNPYTNSINVFSSDPAILLHEAGHAKDYARTRLKGTVFAAARLIPGVDLVQEAYASRDAIRYFYCVDPELEIRAYRTLYPAYATYVGGYAPGGVGVGAAAVLVGHAAGRAQARSREAELAPGSPPIITPEWCEPIRSPGPPD